MNENVTTKDNYEIGKLLFYYLILITDFRFGRNAEIDSTPLWSKSISNELFSELFDKETLEIKIKERLQQLLTFYLDKEVNFTFSLKEIQFVKQHLIGKKVIFYLEKCNENYKVIRIVDEVNKHLNYIELLPIEI